MLRVLLKIIVIIPEKILDWFALLAAFMSVAQTGGLINRMTGVLLSLYKTTQGFVVAYMRNEVFRDVWTRFTAEFSKALENASTNIEQDPQMVLVVFVLTIVCYKLVAWLLRQLRKGVLKKRGKMSETGERQ